MTESDKAVLLETVKRMAEAMERCATALETLSNTVDVTTDSIRTYTAEAQKRRS